MSKIKTAGDLRAFLADALTDIRNGHMDSEQANSISKIAAQINNSLAVEVNTALQLAKMGKDQPVAGSMRLGGPDAAPGLPQPDREGMVWCNQCDGRVLLEDAETCKSPHCSIRKARANVA